jgi:hypothetical protein
LAAAASEITVDELDNLEYPISIRAAQVFVTGGTILIFFAVLYWTALAWAALLSLFGPYQVCAVSCLVCARRCWWSSIVDAALLQH